MSSDVKGEKEKDMKIVEKKEDLRKEKSYPKGTRPVDAGIEESERCNPKLCRAEGAEVPCFIVKTYISCCGQIVKIGFPLYHL